MQRPPVSYPPLFGRGGEAPAGLGRVARPGQPQPVPTPAPSPPHTQPPGQPPQHEHVLDVNVSWVVENPKEDTGFAASFFKRRGPPSPPVLDAVVPEVTLKDFAPYLAQLRAARTRAGLREDEAVVDVEQSIHLSFSDGPDVETLLAAAAAGEDVAAVYGSEAAAAAGAVGGGIPRRIEDATVSVPRRFFDPDFRLEDPGVLGDLVPELDLEQIEATQEALSEFLDTVEWQLFGLIRSRSKHFFNALTTLQALEGAVKVAAARATALATSVAGVREGGVMHPLFVVVGTRRARRKAEAAKLLQGLKRASAGVAGVRDLLATGSVTEALALAADVRRLLNGACAGLTAGEGLSKQLAAYERVAGDSLVADFASAASSLVLGGCGDGEESDTAAVTHSTASSGVGGSSTSASAAAMTPLSPSAVKPVSFGSFVAETSTASSSSSSSSSPAGDFDTALQSRVRPLLLSLLGIGRGVSAIEAFKAAFTRDIRGLIELQVAEAVAVAEAAEAAATGAPMPSPGAEVTPEQLGALSPQAFCAVLSSLASSLMAVLQRVHALHTLVERTADEAGCAPQAPVRAGAGGAGRRGSIGGSTSAVSSAPATRAAAGAALSAAVDEAQIQVVKLLSLRRDQSAKMKAAEMRALWECGRDFAMACAALLAHAAVASGHTSAGGAGLTVALAGGGGGATGAHHHTHHAGLAFASPVLHECVAHAHGMLHFQHGKNMAALSAMIEAETWRQAEVPWQVQAVADAIVASVSTGSGGGVGSGDATSVSSSGAAASGRRASVPFAPPVDAPPLTDMPTAPEPAALVTAPTLLVRGVGYPIVGTGVMLIKMLGDYSSLASVIPDVAGEIIAATVELLRHFNARATQLVLGAGALQTASGLKRITAKHLALTAQTLGAVLALLPTIRASLIVRLPTSQHALLPELTRVTVDIMQHEQRILAKFVAIVRDLMVKCCGDMRDAAGPWLARWGAPDASGSPPFPPAPSPPVKEFTKGLSMLHRILSPILRRDHLQDVFLRTAGMIAAHIPLQYAALLGALADAETAFPGFSRTLAHKRFADDVSCLVKSLSDVLLACVGAGGEETSTSGAEGASTLTRAEAEAAVAPLIAWSTRQFVSGPALPPSPTSAAGAAAAAAEAAAAAAAAEAEVEPSTPLFGAVEATQEQAAALAAAAEPLASAADEAPQEAPEAPKTVAAVEGADSDAQGELARSEEASAGAIEEAAPAAAP